jgi:hypothetical protein
LVKIVVIFNQYEKNGEDPPSKFSPKGFRVIESGASIYFQYINKFIQIGVVDYSSAQGDWSFSDLVTKLNIANPWIVSGNSMALSLELESLLKQVYEIKCLPLLQTQDQSNKPIFSVLIWRKESSVFVENGKYYEHIRGENKSTMSFVDFPKISIKEITEARVQNIINKKETPKKKPRF